MKLETRMANLHVLGVPVGSGGPSQKPYCMVLLWVIFFYQVYTVYTVRILSLCGSYEFINTTAIYF